MITNIIFFIVWTVLVFFIANRRVKKLLDMFHKQEEGYDDCLKRLKIRSEQVDVLMEAINNLNKQLQEVKE